MLGVGFVEVTTASQVWISGAGVIQPILAPPKQHVEQSHPMLWKSDLPRDRRLGVVVFLAEGTIRSGAVVNDFLAPAYGALHA